ncbi:MAG: flagellar basal body P-ring formation chaperone FlgA [Deltaproteobacteria bacterium]|nr:flagellar basal body P-ring formation chaperone FlgA [Deltaproteobacteria bacterium]
MGVILFLLLFLFGTEICLANNKAFLERYLVSEIKKLYRVEEEILVQFGNIPKEVKEEKDVRRIIIAKLPDRKGDGQILLEIEEKSGRKRTAYVPFRVLTMKRFYVLKRDVERGETLKPDDVYESTAFLNDPSLYPSSIEDILGRKLKKNVPANTAITKDLLEEGYLIKRGDVVTVKLENDRMKISTKAISLEKGKLGDLVRLKNISSGKEIVGLISGEKEVTIVF